MTSPAKIGIGTAGAKALCPADALYGHGPGAWGRAGLSGRLVELSGEGASAVLTAAMGLVRDAQEERETTAWVATQKSLFFPPDAAAGGIDLGALAVIRVPDLPYVPRAADKLARSGAFGLIVLDLQVPRYPWLPWEKTATGSAMSAAGRISFRSPQDTLTL